MPIQEIGEIAPKTIPSLAPRMIQSTPNRVLVRRNRALPRFKANSSRRGAAMVEFAVCLPVILLIVFGAIEAASMMFLKQALVQASYESVKIAARNEGTASQAIQAANDVAAGRRVANLNVRFEPSDIENVPRGRLIRVTVTAPANANSLISFGTFRGRTIAADATMVKE
jgi:Flp pilus assembly protein TadG